MGAIIDDTGRVGAVVDGIRGMGDVVDGASCVVTAGVEQYARISSSDGCSAIIRATIDSGVWVEGDPS